MQFQPSVRSPLIHVMGRAAERAARGLVKDFGEVEHLQVSRKGPADFVSVADQRAEKTLREELEKARPSFGFLMEEGGEVAGKDPSTRWIIDPLDGTTNFLHGIPHWCISIAAEKNGEIIAGLVYEPLRDEMFWAEKGGGAFVNAKRLRVSSRKNLEEAVVATGLCSYQESDVALFNRECQVFNGKVAGVRSWNAAALNICYVAAGRLEAFWQRNLAPWDVAAGSLIVREAGGFVTEINGGKDPIYGRSVLATNANLQGPITRLLNVGAPKKE